MARKIKVFDVYVHHGYVLIKPLPNHEVRGRWESITFDRWTDEARTPGERLPVLKCLQLAIGRLLERNFGTLFIHYGDDYPNQTMLLDTVLNQMSRRNPPIFMEKEVTLVGTAAGQDDPQPEGHYLFITVSPALGD
ncbi:hypothetical protein ACFL26_00135 [Patescibacteria group bacterium]